jgi:hypothetical protein
MLCTLGGLEYSKKVTAGCIHHSVLRTRTQHSVLSTHYSVLNVDYCLLITVLLIVVATGGEKCSWRASLKFSRASSSVAPWLATSTWTHCAINHSPSCQMLAENRCFMAKSYHSESLAAQPDLEPKHLGAKPDSFHHSSLSTPLYPFPFTLSPVPRAVSVSR